MSYKMMCAIFLISNFCNYLHGLPVGGLQDSQLRRDSRYDKLYYKYHPTPTSNDEEFHGSSKHSPDYLVQPSTISKHGNQHPTTSTEYNIHPQYKSKEMNSYSDQTNMDEAEINSRLAALRKFFDVDRSREIGSTNPSTFLNLDDRGEPDNEESTETMSDDQVLIARDALIAINRSDTNASREPENTTIISLVKDKLEDLANTSKIHVGITAEVLAIRREEVNPEDKLNNTKIDDTVYKELSDNYNSSTKEIRVLHPLKVLESDTPDGTASQVEKLAQAIGDSYKKLGHDRHQQVVVAYGLDKSKHNSLKDDMIREETEKLNEEVRKVKQLSEKVKQTKELVENKTIHASNSEKVVNAILKYANAFLKKNKPEIDINISDGLDSMDGGHSAHSHGDGWSQWTGWSECTMQCGYHSYRFRHRLCLHPDHCPGDDKERRQCLGLPRCIPSGGIWARWSSWTSCDATCGGGRRSRYRECLTGSSCQGNDHMTESCESALPCTEDGHQPAVNSDPDWTQCSVSCGTGVQFRLHSGERITRKCKISVSCTNSAQWEKWKSWGACSVTCGVGVRVRSRICVSPKPLTPCKGDGIRTEACSIPCDMSISDPYGYGQQQPPVPPIAPDTNLPAPSIAVPPADGEEALAGPAGVWTSWSDWSSCSVSCGVGIEIKHRKCRNTCYGDSQKRRPCVKDSCDTDNVGYAQRLLEGDSTELKCPVEDSDSEQVIWVSPDGQKIDSDSQDKRYELVGSSLEIIDARRASIGTYHCIVTHTNTGLVKSGDISLAVTTCDSVPCKHGGSCDESPNEVIPWLAFTCHCPQGTVGTFCELKLSYSTQFWTLAAIIFSCSLLCLCFAVFAISWKEQREDHGGDTFNIKEYFNELFVNHGCKLQDLGARWRGEEVVRIDVSRPEGSGWLARICRCLQFNRRPKPDTDSDYAGDFDEAMNQFGGDDYEDSDDYTDEESSGAENGVEEEDSGEYLPSPPVDLADYAGEMADVDDINSMRINTVGGKKVLEADSDSEEDDNSAGSATTVGTIGTIGTMGTEPNSEDSSDT